MVKTTSLRAAVIVLIPALAACQAAPISIPVADDKPRVPTRHLLAAPSNDQPENAVPVTFTSGNFYDRRDTTEATKVGEPEPFCWAFSDRTVWYRLDVQSDMTFEVNTSGSDYQTFIDMYKGADLQNPEDHGCAFGQSVQAQAGDTFWFQVGSGEESGRGGQLVIRVEQNPAPIQAELAVDPVVTYDPRTGIATVTGIATLNRSVPLSGGLGLRQRAGRYFINGSFQLNIPVPAEEQGPGPHVRRWTARQDAIGSGWSGGEASGSYTLFASDPNFIRFGDFRTRLRAQSLR